MLFVRIVMNRLLYPVGKRFTVPITQHDVNFDKACESAYQYAIMFFDVDLYGHFNKVQDSKRSTDSLEVEFLSYRRSGNMGGQTHVYTFDIWVERHVD